MKPQAVPASDHELDKHHESHVDEQHEDHQFKEYTPKELRAIKFRGILCLIGGISIHFVLGTFYLWGGISPYVAAYMKSEDSSVKISTMQIVFPILGIITNSVLSFGVKLAQRIGFRIMLFGGGCLISLAFLILSFVNHLIVFILVYCVMIGVSSGLIYMLPIICGWKYFPFNRGMVSGCIIAGYGLGAFTFNFVCQAIANPDNKHPDIEFNEDGKIVKYFGPEVYENVPFMFRILALSYFLLTILGTILTNYPKDLNLEFQQVLASGNQKPSGVNHEKGVDYHPTVLHAECETLGQGLKSRPFFFLFPMILLSTLFGMLMANSYKVYGLQIGLDDQELTIVGSIQAVANAFSRMGWALLMDKIGFKKVFCIVAVVNMACTASMGYLDGSFGGYLVVLSITMACEGGMFSCFPAVSAKIFGHKVGPIIYGGLFFGIGISNMIAYLLYKFTVPEIQFVGLFWIMFGACAVSLLLGLLFKEEHEWKRK